MSYITKMQFYDYIQLLNENKIKGVRLEKYYIGKIDINQLDNNLIEEKIELLTNKINNIKLNY